MTIFFDSIAHMVLRKMFVIICRVTGLKTFLHCILFTEDLGKVTTSNTAAPAQLSILSFTRV